MPAPKGRPAVGRICAEPGPSAIRLRRGGSTARSLDADGGTCSAGLRVGLSGSDRPGHCAHSGPGGLLRCPWHGWEFDIRTGQSWCDPAKLKAKRYATGREPGAALAKGSYVAENFPVSVEEDYVVVEV